MGLESTKLLIVQLESTPHRQEAITSKLQSMGGVNGLDSKYLFLGIPPICSSICFLSICLQFTFKILQLNNFKMCAHIRTHYTKQ